MISVICPVYNTGLYLPRCVDSVINQTYKDFELILVNDISTDKSEEICIQYAKKDPRIKYMTLEKHGGVSKARNTGLENAGGAYIAWIDSDDWAENDWLETMFGLLSGYDADIAIINTRNIFDREHISNKDEEEKNIYILDTDEALENLVDNKYINSGLMDKLFKKDIFTGLLFPEGRKFEDAAVMHILLSRSKKTVFSSEKKYNYFYRFGSITHRHSIQNEYERFLAHTERFDFFLKTNRKKLISKEANIVFLDAVKVLEMTLFRKNSDSEAAMAGDCTRWADNFLLSKNKELIPKSLIKRFGICRGSFFNRVCSFFRYELKNRLKYFILTHAHPEIIIFLRNLKEKKESPCQI
jgi:glycosyltransferase involved in cell wall biosynthesis